MTLKTLKRANLIGRALILLIVADVIYLFATKDIIKSGHEPLSFWVFMIGFPISFITFFVTKFLLDRRLQKAS